MGPEVFFGIFVLLIIAIVLSLLLLGFGNSISLLVNEYVPVIQYVTDFIIEKKKYRFKFFNFHYSTTNS